MKQTPIKYEILIVTELCLTNQSYPKNMSVLFRSVMLWQPLVKGPIVIQAINLKADIK